MMHRSGPFNQDSLIKALKEHLPVNGRGERDVFDVHYMDDDLNEVMIANFIWVNDQWVFIDARSRQ